MAAGHCEFMLEAIRLAGLSAGHTRPNPPVGAVVAKGGRIIGRGRHVKCGCDHAEAAALKDCRESPEGAEVYVTLEPCSKPGRVGACTDALAAAKVKRVTWAAGDPNPVNRGRAAEALRAAGIEGETWAETAGGDERAAGAILAAKELLLPFAKHVTTGLPWVTVKLAMSLDGRIADVHGDARWISSAEMRKATGALRNVADVMMVGGETVRRDDPRLMPYEGERDDLWRAVVSASGDLPAGAKVFTDEARERTIVYRDAEEAIRDLGARGFMHVVCEGGLGLARSLAAAGMVDEWLQVTAPVVIGGGRVGEAERIFEEAGIWKAGGDAGVKWRRAGCLPD